MSNTLDEFLLIRINRSMRRGVEQGAQRDDRKPTAFARLLIKEGLIARGLLPADTPPAQPAQAVRYDTQH